MSKMSATALELDESAVELGFADHLEAMANGYDWAIGDNGVAYLFKSKDPQELAHKAWLEEKACVLDGLKDFRSRIPYGWAETIDVIDRAINFIERGEC